MWRLYMYPPRCQAGKRGLPVPEAPDLEVIKEILTRRVVGRDVTSARVVRPTVLRSLAAEDFVGHITGKKVKGVSRRAKFLFLAFSEDYHLVINPMLSGAFQLCGPEERVAKRTCIVLGLGQDLELRYVDSRQMGIVYYVSGEQIPQVPCLEEQGPDVLDSVISFQEFKDRLRPYSGEIKGILTRGAVLSGIGNAYSDEILFSAGIAPFRRRKSLSDQELEILYSSARQVVADAVVVLRERMGEDAHLKIRDFLQVHNKGGQPCPRCGNQISQLNANQRITSYCRHCQPGMLIRT